jgi:uncharacterized membrane protein YebE (DUF533 family)
MLNPERLLGHLLSGGMRGRRVRNRAALGVGLLGVAMAAYEHFSESKKASETGPSAGQLPPGPPPPPAEVSETESEKAILIIQAMIAAAHADGELDEIERLNILDRTEKAGLSSQEQALIAQELNHPVDMDQLATAAQHLGVIGQVYAVSLATIENDTPQEEMYLQQLADALGLPPDRVMRIHEELGV